MKQVSVWLGDQVIILGEVTIGEGAIIHGSYVVNDIPDFAIAGGHPAKVSNTATLNIIMS